MLLPLHFGGSSLAADADRPPKYRRVIEAAGRLVAAIDAAIVAGIIAVREIALQRQS